MKQTVIYMRHGEYDRMAQTKKPGSLTPYGEETSKTVGEFLFNQSYIPDLCVFSNATRAKETKEILLNSLCKMGNLNINEITQLEVPDLNECWDFDPIVAVLEENQSAKCILIVGHNPIIGALGNMLSNSTVRFNPGSFMVVQYNVPIDRFSVADHHAIDMLEIELA
jgi:phosphohistidine phosphatase SixA